MKPIYVIILVVVVNTAAFFGYKVYQKRHLPASFEHGAGYGQSDHLGNGESGIPHSGDLCGGTGGTGQIVSVGNNTITIKRHDGIGQIITLTDQTTIRNSTGSATKSDLKIGDHVTLVVYDSKTASIVLVCNGTGPKTQSGH